MSQLWEMIFQSEFLFSVIRITAPILFAALGAAIAERAGLTNMGLEGMMMISALFGTLTSYWTQSWIIGVLCALLVGLVLSLMVGFFALKLKTDIILAGIAVNMLGSGGTIFLLYRFTGMSGNTGAAGGIQQESYAAQGHCGFIARPDPSLAFRFPKMYGALHNSNEAATSASRGIAYHTVRLRKPLWAGS